MWICPVCGKKFGIGGANLVHPRKEAERHMTNEHYGSGKWPINKSENRRIDYH